MNNDKHTPGPWEWWTSNSWRRLRRSERGVSTDVLHPCVHKDGQADIEVSQADMALIAAAPDMLAALRKAGREMENVRHRRSDDLSLLNALNDVSDAIAKAEGAP